MSRPTCSHCHRALKACLCHAISPLANRIPVQVLIHPSELKAAKGTARLATQVLANGQLWPGETPGDFAGLRARLEGKHAFLLYPDDSALPVEGFAPPADMELLLLDGTWRKTHKILMLNPWLQALPMLSFGAAPQGNYQIRKANRPDSLSTLEAIAHALASLEGCDTRPLHTAFEALKQSQLGHMPDSVRARYR